MRVALTGATGFIGRHVLGVLGERGHEVQVLGRRRPEPRAGVVFHECDLLDPGATLRAVREARASHLLHLAWDVTPGRYANALGNLDWVAATLRLFTAFQEAGGTRFVGTGSYLEYGGSSGIQRETQLPQQPGTLYGRAKLETSRLLASAAREAGMSFAWGRIFLLYGPFEPPGRLVPEVIGALLEGREARCTSGRQVRDVSYVRDVAAGLVAVLESEVSGAVNVASGTPVRVADLALLLGRLIGRTELIRLGALPDRPGDEVDLVADITRLRTEAGFSPRWSLEAGLTETVAWWQSVASHV